MDDSLYQTEEDKLIRDKQQEFFEEMNDYKEYDDAQEELKRNGFAINWAQQEQML